MGEIRLRRRLTRYWIGSEGLLVLTALRAGRRWGTTSWSRYCLLVKLSGSATLFGFYRPNIIVELYTLNLCSEFRDQN